MSVKKITYTDKVALEQLPDVDETNKVTDANMNEIKEVVNSNAILLEQVDPKVIAKNTQDIKSLTTQFNLHDTKISTNEKNIQSNDVAIQRIDGEVKQHRSDIDNNSQLIQHLQTKDSQQDIDIDSNKSNLQLIQMQITNAEQNIQTNTNDLSAVKPKVDKNKQIIDEIINELRNSNIINYKGEWRPPMTAHAGEIYSWQGKLYICKVSSTSKPPTTSSDWDLISSASINLNDYYTKLEIDNKLVGYVEVKTLDAIRQQITTNTQAIQGVDTQVQTNKQDITSIKSNILLKANQNEVVLLTTDQNINGTKTFTQTVKGQTPLVNEDLTTKQYVDDKVAQISGQTPSNMVTTNTAQTITGNKTFSGTPIFSQQVEMGLGGAFVKVIPEDPSTKTFKFYHDNLRKFNVDLGGFSNLTGIKTPTHNNDAANKQYVDNAIAGVRPQPTANMVTTDTTQTITGEKTFTGGIKSSTPPQTNSDLTTKEYVDNAVATVRPTPDPQVEINKNDITSLKQKNQDLEQQIQQNSQEIQTNQQSISTNNNEIRSLKTQVAIKANDAEVVKLTGDQIINGNKSFTSVVKGKTPLAANDLATKEYVDNKVVPNPQIETNKQDIAQLKPQVQTNTSDLNSYKPKVDKNKQLIDEVIAGLKAATFIHYKGQWTSPTTAKLGQVYSYQGKMYICKVPTTTNNPLTTSDWDLIAEQPISLDGYVTKLELSSTLAGYVKTSTLQALQAQVQANQQALATKANDSEVVKLQGTQTINGEKTFVGVLKADRQPLQDKEVANKQYVDETIDSRAVLLRGSQSIDGVKTFNILPQSSVAPSQNNELVNKEYVDNAVQGVRPQPVSNMVTTDTTQTITGLKTFTQVVKGINPVADEDLATKGYLDSSIGPEVTKQISALPLVTLKEESKDQVLSFKDTNDFNAYKTANNLTDQDFEDVAGASDPQTAINTQDITNLKANKANDSEVVKLSGNQSIAGIKTFTDIIKGRNPLTNEDLTTKQYVDSKKPYEGTSDTSHSAAIWVSYEKPTGAEFWGKKVYTAFIKVGDLTSNNQIAADGTIKTLEPGNFFLGLGFGVIKRSNGQWHNINTVNNLPDQHTSIIYGDGHTIKWYFHNGMTLNSFYRRPFYAQIFYTKNN